MKLRSPDCHPIHWRKNARAIGVGLTAACLTLAAGGAAAQSSPPNVTSVTEPSNIQANPNDAMLVLAVAGPLHEGGWFFSVGGWYEIRQVDLQANKFLAEPIQLQIGPTVWRPHDDSMQGPADSARLVGQPDQNIGPQIEFLIKSLPAGDYAFSAVFITQYTYGTYDACLNTGAVVMHVAPGEITIVNSGDVVPPHYLTRLAADTDHTRVLAAFEEARVNYPEIRGAPVFAESASRILWSNEVSIFRGAGLFGVPCYGGGEFTNIGAPNPESESARAAALEAAQRNLSRSTVAPQAAAPNPPASSPTDNTKP